jgi:hypothetical protein
MKKSSRSFIALAIASMFEAGSLFAAEKAASKVAGCCTKAQGEGKACSHACCVEAAKTGDNCAKCGGAGKIEKKVEAKK